MKLAEWARQQGISYKTAYRLFKAGTLPVRAEQFSTGTIIVHTSLPLVARVVLYARVASSDLTKDLDAQMVRLRTFACARGWEIAEEIADCSNRHGALRLLADPAATHIVIEHKDRLARFEFALVSAALAANGRQLVVVNDTEAKVDLSQDLLEALSTICAQAYGSRAARKRATHALKAASEFVPGDGD